MAKRYSIKIFGLILLLTLAFVFRYNILRSFSNFLIVENDFGYVDSIFVLSGGAFDRGNETAKLFNESRTRRIVCTGANYPPDFKALKLDMLESELTRKNIISQIPDSSKVKLLKIGTSTLEESDAILAYCKENKIRECIILSSKFHTRRVKNVFTKKFKKEGIKVYIKGAGSSSYSESEWWKSEDGLIALNNEYVKLLYYMVK